MHTLDNSCSVACMAWIAYLLWRSDSDHAAVVADPGGNTVSCCMLLLHAMCCMLFLQTLILTVVAAFSLRLHCEQSSFWMSFHFTIDAFASEDVVCICNVSQPHVLHVAHRSYAHSHVKQQPEHWLSGWPQSMQLVMSVLASLMGLLATMLVANPTLISTDVASSS